MATIKIDSLQSGMVVESDVVDHKGRVLLSAGTILDEKHQRIFRMWGIAEVKIQGAMNGETTNEKAALSEILVNDIATQQAKELFRHCNLEHTVVQQLFQISVQKIAEANEGSTR